MKNCLHGIGEDFCATCKENKEKRPVEVIPFVLRSNKNIGLVLDKKEEVVIQVFVFNNSTLRGQIDQVKREDIIHKTLSLGELNTLFQSALVAGSLFEPKDFLTKRELDLPGPPHCWRCKRTIGLLEKTFGCKKCRFYSCVCGACFCNNPVLPNYNGSLIPSGKGLPIKEEERKIYLKIVHALRRVIMKPLNV